MKTTRRGFIKGLAALAALTTMPGMAPMKTDAFIIKARTGICEDQIFFVDGPIIIEVVHNLIIRRCTFICSRELNDDEFPVTIKNSSYLTLESCFFDFKQTKNINNFIKEI